MLTDGKGCFYRAAISAATGKRCQVKVNEVIAPRTFLERSFASGNGTYQEYGPYRMVCRESYGNWFR